MCGRGWGESNKWDSRKSVGFLKQLKIWVAYDKKSALYNIFFDECQSFTCGIFTLEIQRSVHYFAVLGVKLYADLWRLVLSENISQNGN